VPDLPAIAQRIVLNVLVAKFVEDRPDMADAFLVADGEFMIRAPALPQFALWFVTQDLGDEADFAKALDAVEDLRAQLRAGKPTSPEGS
jgi:hypothetical protein